MFLDGTRGETRFKMEIDTNEYNKYDLVEIVWRDNTELTHDDIAEFSWNASKDIAELINSVGTVTYINMYEAAIMKRFICGGRPYTIQ